ncbi:MAG: MFS transporter [Bacteroidales bacterium]|nr:MFS transporter [Bacteroidales bacterium]MDT8374310.1 MFS transporter [Bacteroidales bacterium]
MQPAIEKLSVREKVGYSLGDGAANFIFQTMMLLQLSFYTDTFGLSAGAAATLFLIARLWGAVCDPIFGALADRTNTRWGKFRPWILWTAIPFGVLGYLAFKTPDFSQTGKLIYAYITYLLLLTVYSANNNPYSALSGVITGNMKERTSLSSFRFVAVTLATIAIMGFTLPMVNHFGAGDSARGYQITMGIFSILAIIFFFITFLTTKERIVPPPQQKSSLKQDLSDLIHNRQWVLMFIVFLFMFIFLAMRNSILLYYFKYYLDPESMRSFLVDIDKGLLGLLGSLNMTAAGANFADNSFSVINIIGQLTAIAGIAVGNSLAKRFGKRNVFRTWLMVAGIMAALFFVVPPTGIWAILILSILFNFSWGVTMPLPWAMMADVADFSEWKFSRRATGIVFAGIVVGLKVGLAFGGAVAGWLLNGYGYVANVVQTPTAVQGIRLSVSIFPVIALVLCIISLFIYGIGKKVEYQMQDELAARRKEYEE